MFEEIISLILFLVVFAAILFLAYVTAKYIGIKAGRTMKGKYIEIVDSISLGMDKRLLLVKVANQFILIASSGKSLTYISTVKLDDYDSESDHETDQIQFDFKVLFDKYLKGVKIPKKAAGTDKNGQDDNNTLKIRDSAGESAFKNNLERLRTITRRAETDETGDKKSST